MEFVRGVWYFQNYCFDNLIDIVLNFEFGHDITILKMAKFNNVDHLKLNQHYLKVCEFEILRQYTCNKSTTFPQCNFEPGFPDILSRSLIRCLISSSPGIPKWFIVKSSPFDAVNCHSLQHCHTGVFWMRVTLAQQSSVSHCIHAVSYLSGLCLVFPKTNPI